MSESDMLEALADTWAIDESGFPPGGPTAEKLRFLLNYAVLAPSGHNAQPWLFNVRDNEIEVYADRTRALPVVDPEDRELIIACGGVIEYLLIALHHFGYEGEVHYFPILHDPDLLARVGLGNPRPPTPDDETLFHGIPMRRTNRMAFEERPVPKELLGGLSLAAESRRAWFHIIESEADRIAASELISLGDRVQWSDLRFRRELAAWLHPNRTFSADGIPGYAMGYSDLMSVAAPLVIRTFDLGGGHAARDQELATGSPVLAVLGTIQDEPQDWLMAGQALSRLLLLASAHGVSASFLNQPVEVPDLRVRLLDLIGEIGYPQMVLRMGYGPVAQLTPRRSASQVTI